MRFTHKTIIFFLVNQQLTRIKTLSQLQSFDVFLIPLLGAFCYKINNKLSTFDMQNTDKLMTIDR
ncbi:hypothetical protein IGJ28_003345 [Enterococcus sp. AZ091]